jgi:hypothetical protein
LALEAIVLFLKTNHTLLKSNKLLSEVFGSLVAKGSYTVKSEPIPLHHMHQPMLALKWCHLMCDLAGSCAVYFIVLHVISTSVFLFEHVNSTVSFYNAWKCPFLGPLKDFWVEFAFISFCFCSFQPSAFCSATLNFLAAL